jgi:hypothetical protein
MHEIGGAVSKQTDASTYRDSPSLSLALPSTPTAVESAISITCFDNEIPRFVEPALNMLYGSLYSSMAHFRVHGGIENASTFVARRYQDIVAIFLFRIENRQVRVINEGMPIDEETVTCFANYIFDRFHFIDLISFNAVESAVKHLRFPYQQYNCTEDSVVTLPVSPDKYLNLLGKSTRKNIKQYMNRLKHDYPSFNFQVYDGREVDEKIIRGVIRFNRLRFANKGKVSSITPVDEERIVQMVRECGIVGVCTIDDKMAAGSIIYCIGDHYYSWLKSHDPVYDDYRFGLIGSYLAISECIMRGGKTFHFLWGREPHKALLQGQHRDKFHAIVYRSKTAVLRHADVAFHHACQGKIRQAKLRLMEMKKRDGTISHTVRATLISLRKVKALLSQRF